MAITPPPLRRSSGITACVNAARPKTFVSKIRRHASIESCSSGRCSSSAPALFTRTRKPPGGSKSSSLVTSSKTGCRAGQSRCSAAPSSIRRTPAKTSNPRFESSIATARPMPRLAPVTKALPPVVMAPALAWGRPVGKRCLRDQAAAGSGKR